METVSIEKKTFEELMAQWDAFVEKVTQGGRETPCPLAHGRRSV